MRSAYGKQLRIYAGVDVPMALRCVERYLDTPNALNIGTNSQVIFSNTITNNAIVIYNTPTAIIVRQV